jgi:Flp pilus assembly protein TadG
MIPTLARRLQTRRSRGMVLPLTGLTFFVMICFAGLALDSGHVYIVGQQLQAAGDAAALAGAQLVQYDGKAGHSDTVDQAVLTALKNKADQSFIALARSDVEVGNFDRPSATFTANTSPYNAVKVTTRATTNLLFAPVVNLVLNPGSTNSSFNTSDVSRVAIAMAGGQFAAGLIALDPHRPSSLGTSGSMTLSIPLGGIQVNSDSNTAVTVSGTSGTINATEMRIDGGYTTSGSPTLPSKVYPNTTPVPDPLASLPVPPKTTDLGAINQTKATTPPPLDPGYYSGGITQTKGTLNLKPGVYVLGPPGLQVSGGTFNAPGVMFYITTGTTPNSYGKIDLDGNVNISPPTSGTYKDISIFVGRDTPYQSPPNKKDSQATTLIGNPSTSISGTLYMPSVPLVIKGNVDLHVGNQVIAATVDIRGSAIFTIDYDGRNKVDINEVFLVK